LVQAEAPENGIYILFATETNKPYRNRKEFEEERRKPTIPLALIYVKPKPLNSYDLARKNMLERLGCLPGRAGLTENKGKDKIKTRTVQFRAGKRRAEFRWICGQGPIPDDLPWRRFCGELTDLFVDAGTTERWILESMDDNDHPFHMHVNPFWTLTREDQVFPSEENEVEKHTPVLREKITIGNWYDTVLVPARSRVTIIIHFKANNVLTGKTVFHCHNLYHEDYGMMAAFEIRKQGHRKQQDAGFARLPIRAPKWGFPDTEEKYPQLSLGSRKTDRKVLLVLLRGLGCDHCRAQLEVLFSRYRELQKANYDIIAIAAEPPESLKERIKSLEKELNEGREWPFPVLSAHPGLEVFKHYGCYNRGPLHGTFVIERGTVCWQDAGEQPFMDIYGMLEEQSRP
jgi:peroxiredoxin